MKSAKGKRKKATEDLSKRLLDFTAELIKWMVQLNRTGVGRHISGQLTRSGTSAGANYEEACGAESRADFIHELQIVLKELRESLYGLRLVKKAGLVPGPHSDFSALLQEAEELTKIFAK